jgi:hypothetical protein
MTVVRWEKECVEKEDRRRFPAVPMTILRELHHLLFSYGFHPSPVDAPPALDRSFPNLVRPRTIDRNTDADFTLYMRAQTVGPPTEQDTILSILKPMLRDIPPSISWTFYMAIFCTVASKLQGGIAVQCSPLANNKTYVKLESWEGPPESQPDADIYLLDLADEQHVHIKKAERKEFCVADSCTTVSLLLVPSRQAPR